MKNKLMRYEIQTVHVIHYRQNIQNECILSNVKKFKMYFKDPESRNLIQLLQV